ncbi:hypothetical protein OSB04_un001726 [Centaurea solstitialis]|uniref:Uncharacterized protein n=1 Tax=Centaurea solstitialis TaxID=347529 RepID=A0AA38VQM3_9ASTR|nr:hypothetical protein OSB04_un001726 [Centaurea solstitialis]
MADKDLTSKSSKTTKEGKGTLQEDDDNTMTLQKMLSKMKRRDKPKANEKDKADVDQPKELVVTEDSGAEKVNNDDNSGDKADGVEDKTKTDSANPQLSKKAITKTTTRKQKGMENEKDTQPRKKKIIQDSLEQKKVVVSKSTKTRSVVKPQIVSEAEVSEKKQMNEKKRKRTLKDKGKGKLEQNEGVSIIPTEEIEDSETEAKVVQKKREEARRKGTKKVLDDVKFPTLKIRTSPNSLYLAMQNLGDEQKDWVRRIGFESILQTKIDNIPSKMAFYIVNNLDIDSLKLYVVGGCN